MTDGKRGMGLVMDEKWHKYSEDVKITESGDYVMLLEDCRSLLRHYDVISIRIDSAGTVHHNFDHGNDLRVIAWMKLPNKTEAEGWDW